MDRPPDEPTAKAVLDALDVHPEWDEGQREEHFNRLIERFSPEALLDATRSRLHDLGGARGEAVLRLIEAFGTPETFEALAESLASQPDLPPERAWEALALL